MQSVPSSQDGGKGVSVLEGGIDQHGLIWWAGNAMILVRVRSGVLVCVGSGVLVGVGSGVLVCVGSDVLVCVESLG